MSKKLYGYVSKDNIEYQWKAEATACEVCKSMNGKIYKSANDIPDRPHPNCKCWIDILEKEPKEPITDPIELYREKLKDRKRNEIELAKLLGDVKSLEQEIDEYIRQTEEQENEIAKLEREFDTKPLAEKDKQKRSDLKEQLDFAQYKGQKVKTDIQNLKTKIQSSRGSMAEITKFEFEIRNISQYVDSIITGLKRINKEILQIMKESVLDLYKTTVDILVEEIGSFFKSPNALELYKVGSPNKNNNLCYVQNNGILYNSISDLKNTNLENSIKNRLKDETGKTDCKVLWLKNNSNLAKEIIKSREFVNFLIENPSLFKPNSQFINGEIEFITPDLYNSLHGTVVKNAKTDSQGNLNLSIQDLWNFNAGRKSVRGRVGENLQNLGLLENFYIIIDIKIPKEELEKIKMF